MVRRRDDLARHRPGLQHLHHAAAGAGARRSSPSGGKRFKPHLVRRSSTTTAATQRRCRSASSSRCRGSRSTSRSSTAPCYGVTQEGTAARSFVQRALQVRRQDRHVAGHRHQGEDEKYNAVEDRRAAPRPRALHGVRAARGAADRARPGRRERRLRRQPRRADRAPRARLRALRAVPERGRHRRRPGSASRPRRSACRAPIDSTCRCRGVDRRRRQHGAGPGAGARAGGVAHGAAVSAVFERPSALAARPADLDRLRRAAGHRDRCCSAAPAWSRCTRPASTTARASSTTAATCCSRWRPVRRRAGAAAAADAAGDSALRRSALALLVATAVPGLGITKKGATRWLNVGVTIQPSEIMKIAMPLMLAWWFQRREGHLRALDFVDRGAAPAGAGRPDRQAARPGHRDPGALGRPLRDLLRRAVVAADPAGAAASARSAITAVVVSERPHLPARRRSGRCCTTTRRTASAPCSTRRTTRSARASTSSRAMIAIGSGGIDGKGFMKGTQTHLEFIPERTTDFIFAALCRGVRPGRLRRPAARLRCSSSSAA